MDIPQQTQAQSLAASLFSSLLPETIRLLRLAMYLKVPVTSLEGGDSQVQERAYAAMRGRAKLYYAGIYCSGVEHPWDLQSNVVSDIASRDASRLVGCRVFLESGDEFLTKGSGLEMAVVEAEPGQYQVSAAALAKCHDALAIAIPQSLLVAAATPGEGPAVWAEVTSGDDRESAVFDAREYLATLDDAELLAFWDDDFGCSERIDQVAEHYVDRNPNSEVQAVFDHADAVGCGFEVELDTRTFHAWMAAVRLPLLARKLCELGEVSVLETAAGWSWTECSGEAGGDGFPSKSAAELEAYRVLSLLEDWL